MRQPPRKSTLRRRPPGVQFVQSETKFMSTATPNGFEFVKDAQGRVTHMMLHGEAGEQKAVRKGAAR